MFGKTNHIHFIGIGGIGMSGMAELLHKLGFNISGSDLKQTERTDNLKNLGIKINHFAYPFGQMKDCNFKDSKILHDLGYKSACVAFPFKLYYDSFNQYYLPRIVISDSPISTFKSKLNGCINLFSYLRNKTPNDILD